MEPQSLRQDAHTTVALSKVFQSAGPETKGETEFDLRHHAKDLPDIPDDTEVWITTESEPVSGRVISPADQPQSCVVEMPSGRIECNRSQLTVVPRENSETPETNQPQVETETPRRIMTRSKTGTAINPPNRF